MSASHVAALPRDPSVGQAIEYAQSVFAAELHIPDVRAECREFPGEAIIVVHVPEVGEGATRLANAVDGELREAGFPGFVVVRQETREQSPLLRGAASVEDARVSQLVGLLAAHERTSETMPSMAYVSGGLHNLDVATTPRHHVVFGRRGVGKTALLLEAKARVESLGHHTLWLNMNTYRDMPYPDLVLKVIERVAENCLMWVARTRGKSLAVERLARLLSAVRQPAPASRRADALRGLIADANEALRVVGAELQARLYVFLDDLYYVPLDTQPLFLDALHRCVRDRDVWLKIATIRHQTRCYAFNDLRGLRLGHDAAEINLDVTLENPARARGFLADILAAAAARCGIDRIEQVAYDWAVDRLTMSSGGVPRDFLSLFVGAVEESRIRGGKRKKVGVEDVNRAAGKAAALKEQELAEDAAAGGTDTTPLMELLAHVNGVCLRVPVERRINFLRVDRHAADTAKDSYDLLQRLMDMRFVHLLDRGISDRHHPGTRHEVYLLDFSQYSADRLQRKLRVLDFRAGNLIFRRVGSTDKPRIAKTAAQRLAILRAGPVLDLHAWRASCSQPSTDTCPDTP
ncbi:MAG: hypothetical protein FJX74_05245 [Armatimonadetes bacterium]|nr:hypothetical protein [Armatimonadota bacterium]